MFYEQENIKKAIDESMFVIWLFSKENHITTIVFNPNLIELSCFDSLGNK